jgi:anti-anti-sigma factor
MTPPYFRIDEDPQADYIRLSLIGELDLLSASSFEDRLDELAEHGRDVRLNLSSLDFIASTGVRVLMRALLRSAEGSWRLQIEPNITDTVRRVFNLVNLNCHLVGATPRQIHSQRERHCGR